MNVQKRSDVSIYCLSSGPTLPEWLGDRARRNLSKRDESIRRRIELIQDFQMPSSSSKLVQSKDGRYILAAGTYPPRMRCYDVHDLTMKFERYVNAHVLDMIMLSDDYGKFALLLDDRTIAFHAPYGAHESIRIPTFGRSMAYEPTTCDLLIAAKGPNVYRVNLEEGRFNQPWNLFDEDDANNNKKKKKQKQHKNDDMENSATTTANHNNNNISATTIEVSSSHPLAAVGCDDGIVRFWDNRSPDTLLHPFLKLDVKRATVGYGYYDNDDFAFTALNNNPDEITSIAFDPTGLYMTAGTGGGLVALYDIRSSKPLHIQEHKQGVAIHTIKFHPHSGTIFSSDEQLVKIWRYKKSSSFSSSSFSATTSLSPSDDHDHHHDYDDPTIANNHHTNGDIGSLLVNVEGKGKIADFILAGDETDPCGYRSGLLLCATDQPKMESYYIPAIGLAPKWCSFLEHITEELEERDLTRQGTMVGAETAQQETIYENYKFVTRDDVDKLGLSNLVGTPLLRGYMHGFFMDIQLYNRVRAVANPFEYEEYRKKKLKERMEAKRASRISAHRETGKTTKNKDKNQKALVNPELEGRLKDKTEGNAADTKAGKVAKTLLQDERFGSLFTDPNFQIDEEDENFKLRNPSGVAASNRTKNDLDSDDDHDEGYDYDDHDYGAEDDDDNDDSEEDDDDDSHNDSDSNDDGFRGAKIRGEAYEEMKELNNTKKKRKHQKKEKANNKKNRAISSTVVYEADDGITSTAAVDIGLGDSFASNRIQNRVQEMNLPLAKRLEKQQQAALSGDKQLYVNGNNQRQVVVRVNETTGSKEVTFVPKDDNTKNKNKDSSPSSSRLNNTASGSIHQQTQNKRKRRGVKELGFKTPFRHLK